MLSKLAQIFKRDPGQEKPAQEEDSPKAETEAKEGEDERVYSREERDTQSWLGVGLDGVLAERTEDGIAGEIGPAIPDMVARVRDWVKYKGLRVRVLTPRAYNEEGANQVREWLDANRLGYVDCTSEKDLHMVEYWDDRAVQVISNLGVRVGESPNQLDPAPETQNPESADGKNEAK